MAFASDTIEGLVLYIDQALPTSNADFKFEVEFDNYPRQRTGISIKLEATSLPKKVPFMGPDRTREITVVFDKPTEDWIYTKGGPLPSELETLMTFTTIPKGLLPQGPMRPKVGSPKAVADYAIGWLKSVVAALPEIEQALPTFFQSRRALQDLDPLHRIVSTHLRRCKV